MLGLLQRQWSAFGRQAAAVARAAGHSVDKAARARRPTGAGDWLAGIAFGLEGARRYRLYRPPDVAPGERLPLLVMLHGCGQNAASFALCTRMNRIAARERFFVLYPEQDRLANPQGCWNWFDTDSGRAQGEAALVMKAIDQVCLLYPVARQHMAVAGLSAGASLAAMLAAREPQRFQAVAMHSGVAPGTAHSTLTALRAMQGRVATPLLAADAAPQAWPPLLVIHGSADSVVAPRNAQAAAQAWAEGAGATAGPSRRVQRGQRHAMTITDYKHRSRTVACLVNVAGLGHAWSGGAEGQRHADAKGPDASRLVWAFVARQWRGVVA